MDLAVFRRRTTRSDHALREDLTTECATVRRDLTTAHEDVESAVGDVSVSTAVTGRRLECGGACGLQVEDRKQRTDRVLLGLRCAECGEVIGVGHAGDSIGGTGSLGVPDNPGMPTHPFFVQVPLRWSDMDALRHVNNVQYLRLLEEARILAFKEWFAGADEAHLRPRLLIARAEIDYLRQLQYRTEPICITTWVTRIAGASFDMGYEVRETPEGTEVFAAAETTQVAFDMDTQRPTRLSAFAREVLEQYAGPPVQLKRRPAGHS